MSDDENIWTACADNNLAAVKAFLAADPTLVNKGDEQGYTPMRAAASYGHQTLVTFLLSVGGDLHVADKDGDTPLHHCDSPAMAVFLLGLGARADQANHAGLTPPQLHADDDEEDMVAFWRGKGLLPEAEEDPDEADDDDDDDAQGDGAEDDDAEDDE